MSKDDAEETMIFMFGFTIEMESFFKKAESYVQSELIEKGILERCKWTFVPNEDGFGKGVFELTTISGTPLINIPRSGMKEHLSAETFHEMFQKGWLF